jgi:hypothetical protein
MTETPFRMPTMEEKLTLSITKSDNPDATFFAQLYCKTRINVNGRKRPLTEYLRLQKRHKPDWPFRQAFDCYSVKQFTKEVQKMLKKYKTWVYRDMGLSLVQFEVALRGLRKHDIIDNPLYNYPLRHVAARYTAFLQQPHMRTPLAQRRFIDIISQNMGMYILRQKRRTVFMVVQRLPEELLYQYAVCHDPKQVNKWEEMAHLVTAYVRLGRRPYRTNTMADIQSLLHYHN